MGTANYKIKYMLTAEEEEELFLRFYNLRDVDKKRIVEMRKVEGRTIDEIARRFQITPPDVKRVLNPIPGYGNWTAEEKKRHWLAGQKRSATVKRQRDELRKDIHKHIKGMI